jgi:nucleotide-binding universal stress UspA family protein
MYRNILLATDGSECALRATDHAACLAKQTNAKLKLITVYPSVIPALGVVDVGLADQYIEAQEGCIKAEFSELIARTEAITLKYEILFDSVKSSGTASDEIIAYATKINTDLIVVGHRGLNTVQSFFLGSTSERIVHSAPCSVLVVR